MAELINGVAENQVFAKADYDRLEQAKKVITECQDHYDGLVERIAGQLYVVSKKELYKIDGYTSMGEWASNMFDISKGTCSDAVNTYARFGDKDNLGQIAYEYKDYKFSSLIAMKSMSDEEITLAKIDPTMSRAEIKRAMGAYKALMDKEAQRPKMEKAFAQAYKSFSQVVKGKDVTVDFINIFDARYFEDGYIPSIAFYEDITPAFDLVVQIDDNRTAIVEGCVENNIEVFKDYVDPFDFAALVKTVDGSKIALVDQLNQQISLDEKMLAALDQLIEQANKGSEALEEKESSTSRTEEQSEQSEQPEDPKKEQEGNKFSPHSIPLITIKVKDFTNESGSLNKKEFLARVWEEVSKVTAHDAEMVITFME